MLPELLFSVDSSMQDISRDDFSLLNGECEKDGSTIIRTTSPLASSASTTIFSTCPETPPPTTTTSISSNIEPVNIKLEDSYSNSTSWHNPHQHKFESSKLLLRNSDDPLISRGVTNDDDNPNELEAAVAAATTIKTAPETVKTVTTPKRNRNSNTSANKSRRKGTFKLRFHHQALPPEYLSHYEMTQNQQNKASNNVAKTTSDSNKSKNSLNHIQTVTEKRTNAHETVRNWLEKISQIQTVTSDNQNNECTETDDSPNNKDNINMISQSPRKVVKYSDLPYMGEITLANSKPRRGRKPKKADICHLIYKNYGTILPGTPKDKMDTETKGESKHSLLEKCLSQDIKDIKKEVKNATTKDEPLNLCLRDQSGDFFELSSDDENSDELDDSTRTSPNITQSDPITDSILAANLKMALPNFQSVLLNNKSDDISTPSTGDSGKLSPPSYPYWSNTDVFLHPMALYYQKMIDACGPTHLSSTSTATTDAVSSNTTTTTTATTTTQASLPKFVQTKTKSSPKMTAKILPQLIKREKLDQMESRSTPSSTRSSNSNSGSIQSQLQPAQKRKRSAIFIPPMPAENTTNPATEVSICKFKFTGGAKPSLQEKKILSVDSDGNYRYYSGTGDKSMRGYEFFPRETLQQSGVIPGVNCSEAFLNATGEKIPGDLTPSSAIINNELLQLPNSLTSGLLFPNSRSSSLLGASDSHRFPRYSLSSSQASDRRKRKSKRSMQREKLEQTFKEKGFLIQTQQLESAEGATYCKFRQLRKFTRYLFRSWKDYLPDEIQQANAAAVAAAAAAAANQETSPICDMIEATSGDVQLSSIEKSLRKSNNGR